MSESVLFATREVAFVLGLGMSGLSACYYLERQGLEVYATDDEESKVSSAEASLQGKNISFFSSEKFLQLLEEHRTQAKFFVVSPGIGRDHPVYKKAKELGLPITGDVELGCRLLQPCGSTIIGITGTNGKTTVTLLIEHILNAAGRGGIAAGNVGKPILNLILEGITSQKALALELSSFQLETMNERTLDFGVILNITPDHLDRYSSMREYAQTKCRIANCLKEKGRLFVAESVLPWINELQIRTDNISPYGFNTSSHICLDGDWVIRLGQKEVRLPSSLQQKRNHDVENFLAAYAVCRELGINSIAIVEAYDSFKKPPHRIEYVCTIKDVEYWDDSKGTNLDSVIRAVESVPHPIHLIVGGVHKGEGYQYWIPYFKEKVATIFAIGQAAPLIKHDLAGHFEVKICKDLEEAVNQASVNAKPGETVMLSPGCSSYDMFRDYKERGEKFKQAVFALK